MNRPTAMKATNSKTQASTLPADIPPGVIADHDRFSLISGEKLHALYAAMVRSRILAERLRHLHPASSFAPQDAEAAAAGVIADLLPHDYLVLSHRDLSLAVLKGVSVEQILFHLSTRTANSPQLRRGASRRRYSTPTGVPFEYPLMNVVAPTGTVAARLHLATGLAYASKMQGHGGVVAVFAGRDSATRAASTPAAWQKSWIEALKVAAASRLPILFVCQSNMATEDARPVNGSAHAHSDNPGEIGIDTQSLGFPSIPVDGNDAVAVYRVACESIFRIRQGRGPTLIDCKTWRIHGHTPAEACDSIRIMENYLASRGLFSAEHSRQLAADFNQELDSALAAVSRDRRKTRK
jgi:pyruvate dehydrogenase E1 component alpha subunit